MKKSDHQMIRNCEIGDNFEGVYYLESLFFRETKQKKTFTDLMLRDRSGARGAKYWDKLNGVESGGFVFVAGRVEDYMGAPSIVVQNVEAVDTPDDLSDHMAVREDVAELTGIFDDYCSELAAICEEEKDEAAILLVNEVFRSGDFFSGFIDAPGGIGSRYGCRGGLLASTVRVVETASDLSSRNNIDGMDRVILLAAALVHRIGAVDAYEFVNCVPVETKKGVLLGAGNLTMTRISGVMRKMSASAKKSNKEWNQDVLVRILHCVASCRHNSEVRPMTMEAMCLEAACRADYEISAAQDFVSNDLNVDGDFTAWDSTGKRRYLRNTGK